jgi:hypothetical protein
VGGAAIRSAPLFFAISDPKGEEKAFFAERNFDI